MIGKVVSGAHAGKGIAITNPTSSMSLKGRVVCVLSKPRQPLTENTVVSWEEVDSTTKTSGVSAVARAGVGAVVLGPIGIAAALSAKKKTDHLISIVWQDGQQSLIQLDQQLFEQFAKGLYQQQGSSPKVTTASSADEIAKHADLLAKGYITQEEYDQKKKELLGL